jgi:nucleoside-diphosphate-sugar epimerase
MKILITGAAGFIGSHLYEKLKHEGHKVIGIDNFYHASLNPIIKEVKYADVRYTDDLDTYVKWSDVVYHLAAQIHVDRSISNPQETVDINIGGTLNVLELVKKYNKKMVFASSSEVYGTQEYAMFYCKCHRKNLLEKGYGSIPEIHPLNAQSPYAASKVAGDRLCKSYFDTYGTKVAILRNFNTFGPFQADGSYGSVIAKFIKRCLRGEQLEVYGTGKQSRDYMDVSDALRGYELCLKKGLWGTPINIGTGKTIEINWLASTIKELTKSKSNIIHTKERPGEVQRLCANIAFASSLGFKPQTDFIKHLTKYINWFKKQR